MVATRSLPRILAVAIGLLLLPLAGRAEVVDERQVKAAFLYNFAKFVEWPSDILPDASGEMVLCLLGDGSLGEPLESTVAGKTVRNHRLVVRNVYNADEARQCHVLFLTSADPVAWRGILGSLEGAPVLTVGDGETFARRGGIIAFKMEGNKVRFAINADAASRARLQISSQLLKLAAFVIGGPPR
jgi:hypothetical protein